MALHASPRRLRERRARARVIMILSSIALAVGACSARGVRGAEPGGAVAIPSTASVADSRAPTPVHRVPVAIR